MTIQAGPFAGAQSGFMSYYNSGSAKAYGDVVLVGQTVGVVDDSGGIAAGGYGRLRVSGIIQFCADTTVWAAGDSIYWNATGNPQGGVAGTGCATSTSSGATLIGPAEYAKATGDVSGRVINSSTTRVNTSLSGSINADAITSTDSSLGISGLGAAQGGVVAIVGGASSTSGNAGGAVTMTGGTPGATGIGGAVAIAGAAGGATSGAGGAVTVVGGAGTAGNAIGGAISITGGAGQGSAAGGASGRVGGAGGATGIGGAITDVGGAGGATSGAGGACTRIGGAGTAGNAAGGAITDTGGAGQGSAAGGAISQTGGAGGATGAGGAVTFISGAGGATSGVAGSISISVGSCTSGNGSAITITSGNGAGGTNSGGNINLIPGTAVSTGTPGEFQVATDSGIIHHSEALTATDATRTVFVATRSCRFKGVKEVHSTASTSGTLQIEKCTSTTAPGSGTVLLTGTMSLAGTANTVVSGTLISTVASLTLAAGDRLSIVIAGTMTNLAGGRVTLMLTPC